MRLLLILVLAGLMDAARSFAPQPGVGSGAAGTALACGYLLLTAFLIGSLSTQIKLPALTGYILAGMVVGPQVLHLVSAQMVDNLHIFNGVAVALIALTAGVELDLRSMQPLFRSIGWLIVVAVLGTAVLLSAAIFVGREFLPFMAHLTLVQSAGVAATLGVTMAAQSPAVVVALRSELHADGPLSQTVLGVVVMSDLLVILLFAVVSSITRTLFGGEADALHTAGLLAWEIFGSIAIGVVVGAVIGAFLRHATSGVALFVVVVAFVVAEVGERIDLDPLIVTLAAGMLVRNATRWGHKLYREVEEASLPVYVVFFAITGAAMHLNEMAVLWVPALALAALRASSFLAGSRLAGHIAKAPAVVGRYAAYGLMPQAGLALALALLFVRTFPNFGAAASALVLTCVAINQVVTPVAYRFALVHSGEAGQWKEVPETPPAVPQPG